MNGGNIMSGEKIISDAEIKRKIADYRLLDDVFLTVYFKDNIEGVQFILRIILDIDDLTVTEVKVQEEYKNIKGRSVKLDITAKDSTERIYNIEIQRADGGAIPKRARYHSAMLDSNELQTSKYFDALPETYVIFITENDIFKRKLPIYKIDRYIECENGEKILFGDEAHIIYVNGEIHDETKLGHLMHDFFCKNANDMHYGELAEKMRFFKEDERGNAIMANSIEEITALKNNLQPV